MLALKTYEQTAVFDPTNPQQVIRENYTANPGGWGSFYFNRLPNEASLEGLGAGGFSGLPNWAQIAIVGGSAAALGYFGMKHYGSRLKPTLRRLPVVGKAFAGLGRSRRRRRR